MEAVYLYTWVGKGFCDLRFEAGTVLHNSYIAVSISLQNTYFFSLALYVALLQLKYKPGGLHCIREWLGWPTSLAALHSWWRVISVGLVSFSGYFPLICAFCCCTTNTPREMIHAIIRAVPYTM